MSNRDRIRESIAAAVSSAVEENRPVDVNELALQLSSLHPQSGLLIDEICAEIERALAATGAAAAGWGAVAGRAT